MDFKQIENMVFCEDELSPKAELADMYAYYILKAINCLYLNKKISKAHATKEKNILIKEYEDRKKYDAWRESTFKMEVENISKTQELRAKLNKASLAGKLDKEIWLDAVECINRLCGDSAGYKCCVEYLKDYKEEEDKKDEPKDI